MESSIQIADHRVNEKALEIALKEYRNFSQSEDYKEEYKWEILQSLNTWIEDKSVSAETVQELVKLMQEKNPSQGSLVDWRNFQDAVDYAEENPERFAELLQELYNEDKELEKRISSVRNEISLKTDTIAYLLAAYDYEKYAPFKQNKFVTFMEDIFDEDVPKVGSMSLSEKYAFYTEFCNQVGEFANETDIGGYEDALTASALVGQDIIYVVSSYPQPKNTFRLKYLFEFSKKLEELKEEPEKIVNELEKLPKDFLEEQEEEYSDESGPVRTVRHRAVQNILNGEEQDIEEIKTEVDRQHDKEVFHSYKNFHILSYVYINYFKGRTNHYLDKIGEELVEEIGENKLDSHTVGFEGAQNFPSDKCWLALFPASYDNHSDAYLLTIAIKRAGLKYGIDPGDNVKEKDYPERETVTETDEIDYQEILQSLKSQSELFYKLNDEQNEEDEELEEPQRFDEIKRQLEKNSQVLFYGPVGTGKTYTAKKFAEYYLKNQENEDTKGRLETITFHPSVSYEDFIEGLTAQENNGKIEYKIKNGIFKELANEAREAYQSAETKSKAPKFVLIIDEINRGNIPKILGETITLLEDDKRLGGDNETHIKLSHSGDSFSIPPNLKIIGTMNTADRSISLVDTAIRRRFRFLKFTPDYQILLDNLGFEGWQELEDTIREDNDSVRVLKGLSLLGLKAINQSITASSSLGKGKEIGHSFLLNKESKESITDVWKYEILPLLEEYYYSQFEQMKSQIFAGEELRIIDWDKQEIEDFTPAKLRESLEQIIELEGE